MKHLILTLALITGCLGISAQSDVHYSMFKLNRQIFNPAATGANDALTFTSHFREQWGNFPGAPRTITLQGHAPIAQDRAGLGVSFIAEEIGIVKTNLLSTSYAYHIKLSERSILRIGVHAQLEHGRVRYNMVKVLDVQDRTIGEMPSRLKGNIGAGAFYEYGEFYVGVSVPRFFKSINYGEDAQSINNTLGMSTYYMQMGTAFRINENMALEPGLLISANPSAPFEFDLNLNLLLFDRFGVGMAYRFQDSADAIFQFKLNNRFKLAAGIDFTISGLQQNAPTSFELLAQYEMNYEDNGVRNIRFF